MQASRFRRGRRFFLGLREEGGGPIYRPGSRLDVGPQRVSASPKPSKPIEDCFLTSLRKIQARGVTKGAKARQARPRLIATKPLQFLALANTGKPGQTPTDAFHGGNRFSTVRHAAIRPEHNAEPRRLKRARRAKLTPLSESPSRSPSAHVTLTRREGPCSNCRSAVINTYRQAPSNDPLVLTGSPEDPRC